MSELSTLLADAAVAARPTGAPPYEALVRRRRRRDRRTRAVAGLGVLLVAAGAAALVPGLTQRDDRALPPAGGDTQEWREQLLSDVQLGVQLQFQPLQGPGFSFLLSEGFTDEIDYEDRTAPGALVDGAVTLTAHRGDEVTCLRAEASRGVLSWQEPTPEVCADREASVVDLELDLVRPASERFADNPLVEDGRLRPRPS